MTTGKIAKFSDRSGTASDKVVIKFVDTAAGIPVVDPRCPAADGLLILQNDGGAFTATLPCANWTASGAGFVYKDAVAANGVKKIILKDKKLIIKGKGDVYGTSALTSPSTFLQVELRFVAERYCGRFQGPTSTFDNSAHKVVVHGPSLSCTPSTEVTCAAFTPPAMGTCEVIAGSNAKLITGEVLAPDIVYHGGQVLVTAMGVIDCVGCNCTPFATGATQVRCPKGVISPGLINTHDHLSFTQNNPHTDTGERYEQRHDWRLGLNGHTMIPAPGGASTDQKRWGELRFVMGGTTSIAGAGSTSGLLRNLDTSALQEGLGQIGSLLDTFPLGDAASGTQLASGCGYPSIRSASSITGEDAYVAHVAEGIDAFARNEFVCLSSFAGGGQDLVQPQSTFVHSVGLEAADYALMVQDRTKLIWSPRSNLALYGATADVTAAARLGVHIALGTDWIVTGSMNMLRELRCADRYNQTYLNGFFADADLWKMVTVRAAEATATDDAIGLLRDGYVADIAIFNGAMNSQYGAVIRADPQGRRPRHARRAGSVWR